MTFMTATELIKNVGRTGLYRVNGFSFRVRVKEARIIIRDQVQLLVAPIAGQGEDWIASGLISLDDPRPPMRRSQSRE